MCIYVWMNQRPDQSIYSYKWRTLSNKTKTKNEYKQTHCKRWTYQSAIIKPLKYLMQRFRLHIIFMTQYHFYAGISHSMPEKYYSCLYKLCVLRFSYEKEYLARACLCFGFRLESSYRMIFFYLVCISVS